MRLTLEHFSSSETGVLGCLNVFVFFNKNNTHQEEKKKEKKIPCHFWHHVELNIGLIKMIKWYLNACATLNMLNDPPLQSLKPLYSISFIIFSSMNIEGGLYF